MDLLSQRYASPYLIMDDFIRLHQFHDFVVEVLTSIADEKLHETRWQYYLHRVWNMSYEEFVRKCEKPQQSKQYMSNEEIGSVIGESKKILEGFKMPE